MPTLHRLVHEARGILIEQQLAAFLSQAAAASEIELPDAVGRSGGPTPGWVVLRKKLVEAGWQEFLDSGAAGWMKDDTAVICWPRRSPVIRFSGGDNPQMADVAMALAHEAASDVHMARAVVVQTFSEEDRGVVMRALKKQGFDFVRMDAWPSSEDSEKMLMVKGVDLGMVVNVIRDVVSYYFVADANGRSKSVTED